MTEFEKKVYNVVKRIPTGRVMTYAQVARAIGNPGSARAVGNALNKNCDLNVPCHRVVRSDGKIGGYNKGAEVKARILRKEGISIY